MSVTYQIDPDLRLVLVEVRDQFNLHQAIDAMERFNHDARADFSHDFLFDCSRDPKFDLDFSRMLTMIGKLGPFHRQRSPESLSVCYAPGDVAFGMARMYQSLVADKISYRLELCRSRLDVARALDRSVEDLFAVWPEI